MKSLSAKRQGSEIKKYHVVITYIYIWSHSYAFYITQYEAYSLSTQCNCSCKSSTHSNQQQIDLNYQHSTLIGSYQETVTMKLYLFYR